MARIFVTGGRGYLGQSVVHHLAAAGHEISELTGRLADVPAGSVDTDCAVHLAAALRDRPPDEVRHTNVEGTRTLIRALRPEVRVVFLSSRAVYGVGRPPPIVTEDTTPVPGDVYGRSKLEAERLVATSGHPFVILRPTVLFGAGRSSHGRNFVNHFIHLARRGATLQVQGGQQLVDPVSVDDVARHVAAFVDDAGCRGEVFNAAGARAGVLDIAQLIVSLTAEHGGPRSAIAVSPDGEPDGVLLDAGKLAAYSPHRTATPLEDVIRTLIGCPA